MKNVVPIPTEKQCFYCMRAISQTRKFAVQTNLWPNDSYLYVIQVITLPLRPYLHCGCCLRSPWSFMKWVFAHCFMHNDCHNIRNTKQTRYKCWFPSTNWSRLRRLVIWNKRISTLHAICLRASFIFMWNGKWINSSSEIGSLKL